MASTGPESDELDAANQTTYASKDSVSWYGSQSTLQEAEVELLGRLGTEITGGRVLDIGVGGGRTTGHLFAMAREYVGVDYVPELVKAARRNHPQARLEVADGRDLSRFEDGSFDVVFFSFNGIDGVRHADRLAILKEVRRVLKPGGAFLFSAHNRDWDRFGRMPWQGTRLVSRTTLKKSLRALLATPTRRRLRRQEEHTSTYAIVNDEAHRYSLLLYYIDERSQIEQLKEQGFRDVVVHDMHGRPGTPLVADTTSIWLHYLARA